MKTFLYFLLASALLILWGCSSSYKISNGSLKRTHTFSWLNEELAGKVVDIYTANGKIEDACNIHVEQDSVTWNYSTSPEIHSLPLSKITRIRQTNHITGFFEGFFAGMVGGTAALYFGLNAIGFSLAEGENVTIPPFLRTVS